jgi:hypothetical protein
VRPVILVRPASSEPTPWATGLTVTAMVAAISGATDVVLTLALQAVYGWLCIPANVLLGGGLAPSVWLLRKLPTWRWVSYGVVIGFACAWIALALGALFRVRG